jgi:hypothetical protein
VETLPGTIFNISVPNKTTNLSDAASSCSTGVLQQKLISINIQYILPVLVKLFIGDSYVQGFASELTQRLGTRYKIIGYVKPNVEVSELIDTAKDEVSELTGKDIVIFCGGANNMDRNTAGKGLSQVIHLTNQHTNIIFIGIPYRFDQKIRLSMNEDIRN